MSTKAEVFYTKNQAGITLIVNGVPRVVDRTNPHFDQIEVELKAGNYARVLALANLKTAVAEAIKDAGADSKLSIRDGEIYWNGPRGLERVEGPLTERIVATIRNGMTAKAVQPLVRLLTNISRNQYKDLREELYEFLMSGKMPITHDGCFLAYKKVRADFKDIYSGRFDNSPGKLVVMERSERIDTNRHNTCSHGLHFCARSYLSSYSSCSGNKIVVVKVNPRHVFAIPTDYDFAKGRASEYYVVGECTGNPYTDEAFLAPFIFDENKATGAPGVKFVEPDTEQVGDRTVTSTNLAPSLKTIAEGYGFSADGKAWVRVETSKGAFSAETYIACERREDKHGNYTYFSGLTGKEVPIEHIRELSIQTKSVRTALARACAKRRNRRY